MVHGSWPPEGTEIDHINGDKADNRIANLRLVTRVQNLANLAPGKLNKSGVLGVNYNAKRKKWVVTLGAVFLGHFSNKEDAVAARQAAEAAHFGEYRRGAQPCA